MLRGGIIHWLTADGEDDRSTDGSDFDYLSPAEVNYWRGQKTTKRRQDWLLGRWATKHLLQGLLLESSGLDLSLDQIEIIKHIDGWPYLRLSLDGKLTPDFTISISHSHHHAFCAVIEGPGHYLGADIEFIEPRSAGFVADYFTPVEQAFLAAASGEPQPVLANAIWSGKEAALKAVRRGLAEDTRIISCLPHPPVDNGSPWMLMRLTWERGSSQPELSGWWRRKGDFVMTLAADRATA